MAVAGEYFARGGQPLALYIGRRPPPAGRDRRLPAKRPAAAVAGSAPPPASRKPAEAHGGSPAGIGTPPLLMNMKEPGRLTPRRGVSSGRSSDRRSTRSML